MSAVKTLFKAGVGAGALVLGAGALVYECALNTKINSFFINKFDDTRPDLEGAEQVNTAPAGPDWFDTHKGEDQVIATEATGRTHAYVIRTEEPSHKWAVLCHGFNSSPKSSAVYAEHFHNEGYNCVVPSMRAWGNDENRYCSMGYRDKDICRAWIDYVVIMDPEAQIVLHGYSMGAVTIMLATGETLPEQVKAAVADCGFTTCWEQYANVIKHYAHLPSFPLLNAINVISIARGNFDIRKNRPIDAVARSVTPTVFLHGTADDFVKFEMMDRLYEACAAPKAKQAIEGGLHAASVEKDPALYWKTVDEFLKDYITV